MSEEKIKGVEEKVEEAIFEQEFGEQALDQADQREIERLTYSLKKKGYSEGTARDLAMKIKAKGVEIKMEMLGEEDKRREIDEALKQVNYVLDQLNANFRPEPSLKDYEAVLAKADRMFYRMANWLGSESLRNKVLRKYTGKASKHALKRTSHVVQEVYSQLENSLERIRDLKLQIEDNEIKLTSEASYIDAQSEALVEVYKQNERRIAELKQEVYKHMVAKDFDKALKLKNKIIELQRDNYRIKKALHENLSFKKRARVMIAAGRLKEKVLSKIERIYEEIYIDLSKRKAEIDVLVQGQSLMPLKLDEKVREVYELSSKAREKLRKIAELELPDFTLLHFDDSDIAIPDADYKSLSVDELYQEITAIKLLDDIGDEQV